MAIEIEGYHWNCMALPTQVLDPLLVRILDLVQKNTSVKLKYLVQSTIVTDRVRSTREGYVLTRVCPSICLSTGGEGVPQPGPAGGGGGYSPVQGNRWST